MKEFPDLEKRLIMLEVAVQDLEDRSLADSLVLAWLLQRITRQEPTSIEQVRRFLQAQAKPLSLIPFSGNTLNLCLKSLNPPKSSLEFQFFNKLG